jgi:MFS family permease
MQLVSKTQLPRIKHRTAALVYFFISGFGYSTWASRIPAIQHQLHINEAQLGAALLAAPVGVLITVPFSSNLLNRYSSKSIIIFGAVFYNLVLALLSFVTQLWQLCVLLFCFGSSRNILNLSTNAQGVEVQQLYENSIITSFHAMWSSAGFAGAAVGYFFVLSSLPLSVHFITVSIVLLVLSVIFYQNIFYIRRQDPPQRKKIFVWPHKTLLVFALIAFASMACENVMYDWSAIFFQKAVLSTKETATAAFVLYMVCMTTGRLLGDKFVRKIGMVRILRYSGILVLTGLLLASLFPYVITAGVGFALIGFGISCIIPLVFNLAGNTAGMSSGTAIASVSVISYFGFLAIPPAVGFVAQAVGMRWSFCMMSVFALAIFLLASTIKSEK